jgi:hypothetical protein
LAVAIGEATPPSDTPCCAVVTFSFREREAGFVPRQNWVGLFVEDEVAANRCASYEQHLRELPMRAEHMVPLIERGAISLGSFDDDG